jgi:hypothetical protein
MVDFVVYREGPVGAPGGDDFFDDETQTFGGLQPNSRVTAVSLRAQDRIQCLQMVHDQVILDPHGGCRRSLRE